MRETQYDKFYTYLKVFPTDKGFYGNETPESKQEICEGMIPDIKRHIDLVGQMSVDHDEMPVCSHCGDDWDDNIVLPLCCEEAEKEFMGKFIKESRSLRLTNLLTLVHTLKDYISEDLTYQTIVNNNEQSVIEDARKLTDPQQHIFVLVYQEAKYRTTVQGDSYKSAMESLREEIYKIVNEDYLAGDDESILIEPIDHDEWFNYKPVQIEWALVGCSIIYMVSDSNGIEIKHGEHY